ncbi:Histidine phosphatase superfamily (branch 2) [Popillia japonica]
MPNQSLISVHAIFRHGERTPDRAAHYPNDPYINHKYEPYGYGQLTNEGKKTMYELGNLLRNTYDNYLGNRYKPENVEALSTNVDRTKASLQLVLAGLFPPKDCDIWNDQLDWQPIPFNVDNKFLERITNHPEFLPTYNRYYETEKGQKILKEHREFLAYIKNANFWPI